MSRITNLLPDFLASREARNLRSSTLAGYKIWAAWMNAHWGDKIVTQVTAGDIVGLVATKSRNHAMITQVFFRWLIDVGTLPRLFDCGKLPLPPLSDEREIRFLRAVDAHRFLEAVKPKYRAAFILALFAGLRPYEIARMHWESIHVSERRIRVEARVSKIRRARILEGLPPILWRLLKPYAKKHGRVVTGATSDVKAVFRILHERTRAAREAEVKMGHDIFRHTFATFFVALTGNLGAAAKILGHYELRMLTAHYDGVATKAEAKVYFAGAIFFAASNKAVK